MAIDSETVIGQLKILNGATSKVEQNTNPVPSPTQTIPVQVDRSIDVDGDYNPGAAQKVGGYIVPPKCKAHVEFVSMGMMRVTAATTVGESQLYVRFGAWQGTGVTMYLPMINNIVGGSITQLTSTDFWLYGPLRSEVGNDAAGDNVLGFGGKSYAVLVLYTDSSSGATPGTVECYSGIRIREYSQ